MSQSQANLKRIFDAARELPAGPARSSYLRSACGGAASLREQVEALLRASDEAGRFLDSALPPDANLADPGPSPDPTRAAHDADFVLAIPDATVDQSSGDAPATTAEEDPRPPLPPMPMIEGPGSIIGRYKLLQNIGEGGMGTVFMAEQDRPIRRKVALKVIKPGMDTRQVVIRFEAERQALALMDHPNIARVLDAGATATGRPFFVMELVRGVPITEYCDRNHLTPRERLELFLPVCRAIQHAHQKGIIHRDIKPNNVLVTLHDGVAQPKVIDFGVAKATEQRLTERTMFTEFGAIIGTLEYMSPEQAEVGALDIDTRSDIYSLGVLLYELLTGSTPLDKGRLRRAAHTEILRRIREEEPAKPSTRLSDSHEALASISAQRKTEPARLSKLVRGDLDWIVMKALDKDRTRRYETATGFARDIQRHLDGDAVEASPPSARYKLLKYARKHRVGLSIATAFALLLIVATVTSGGLAFWVNQQRLVAEAAKLESRQESNRARQAERKTAEQRDQLILAEEQSNIQRKRALKAEAEAKKHEAEAKNQQALAQERAALAVAALKRMTEVIEGNQELTTNIKLASLRQALLNIPHTFFSKLRTQLQNDPLASTTALTNLAEANQTLGDLVYSTGNPRDTLRDYLQVQEIYDKLLQDHPEDQDYRLNLAYACTNVGLVQSLNSQSGDQALASFRRASGLYEELQRDRSNIYDYGTELATLQCYIGSVYRYRQRWAETQVAFEEARTRFDQLDRQVPGSWDYRRGRARALRNLGKLERDRGHLELALALFEQTRDITQKVVEDYPDESACRKSLIDAHCNISLVLVSLGRPTEAVVTLGQARVDSEDLLAESPDYNGYRERLIVILGQLRLLHEQNNRRADALVVADLMRPHLEFLVSNQPDVRNHADQLRECEAQIASLRRQVEPAAEHEARGRDAMNLAQTRAQVAAGTLARLDAQLQDSREGRPPGDAAERISLALRAHNHNRHAVAVQLFTEAFAADPRLTTDLASWHQYYAACSAVLLATGASEGGPPLDEATRLRLRQQALRWLTAELAQWNEVAAAPSSPRKRQIGSTMRSWLKEEKLTTVRDTDKMVPLPPAEANAWRDIWSNVARLRAQAETTGREQVVEGESGE